MVDDFLCQVRERIRGILRTNRRNYKSPRFDTSDILQDSMIQICREEQVESGETPTISQGRLRAIALGHLAKHLRFNYADKRSVDREKGGGNHEFGGGIEMDPQQLIAKRELIESLINSLTQLEPQQREIVTLRFFHDATYEEIATRLGINVYTVRTNLLKTLKFLYQQIEPRNAAAAGA